MTTGLHYRLLLCAPLLSAFWAPPALGCSTYSCKPTIDQADAATMFDAFSKQTGFQVAFLSDAVGAAKLHPVQGQWPAIKSLVEMLRGTGLSYSFVRKDTIAIFAAEPPKSGEDVQPLAQVIVQALESGGELSRYGAIQISPADMAATGRDTLQDILRTYPQVDGGVCDNDLSNRGRDQQSNSTWGCGVDIRGFGPDATVVVVNGRRIAPSGTGGLFVDVSHLPLGAVERVEMLPDGSSVLYGADAIGGTVNFVLRQSFDGFETDVCVSPGMGSAINEERLSQIFGKIWGSARYVGVLEYSLRDALPASKRSQATSDLVPFGGKNYGSLLGDPGTIVIGSNMWAIPSFQPGAYPVPSDFTEGTFNLHDIREGTDILPRENRLSAYFSGSLDFPERGQLFSDLLITRRKVTSKSTAVGISLQLQSSNPYYVNPTGGTGPIEVYDGFLSALGPAVLDNDVWDGAFTFGGKWNVLADWEISGYVGYSLEWQNEIVRNLINPYALETAVDSSSTATAFDPITPSLTSATTLREIRTYSRFRSDTGYRLGNVTIRGGIPYPLGDDIRVTAGADFRGESLDTFEQAGDYATPVWTNSQRSMIAAFEEVCIPLTESGSNQCGDREQPIQNHAQLIISDRYEHYSRFGGQAAPDARLNLAVLSGLSFEVGRRRSFKVPGLADLNQTHDKSEILPLANPLSPSGISQVLGWTGSNADLHAEAAWTWTFSAAINPPSLPLLKIEAHAFDTDYRNRIEAPIFGADSLTNPSDGDIVIQNPTLQQRSRVCDGSQFSGTLADCMNAKISAIVDGRLQNQARLTTSGVCLNIEDGFQTEFGKWSAKLNSTYIFQYISTDPSGSSNQVNTPDKPLRFRMLGAFSWSRGSLQSTAFVHYSGGYHDPVDQPPRDVRSWTTVDLRLARQIPVPEFGLKADALFSISVQNLFNVDPPFVDSALGIGFDTVNATDRGRVLTVAVKLHW